MFHDSDLQAYLYAHIYWLGDGKPMKIVQWLDERGW
jgi:hypothetical protein